MRFVSRLRHISTKIRHILRIFRSQDSSRNRNCTLHSAVHTIWVIWYDPWMNESSEHCRQTRVHNESWILCLSVVFCFANRLAASDGRLSFLWRTTEFLINIIIFSACTHGFIRRTQRIWCDMHVFHPPSGGVAIARLIAELLSTVSNTRTHALVCEYVISFMLYIFRTHTINNENIVICV